eukprot:Colp12_sorted_trinity150504_noHs@20960
MARIAYLCLLIAIASVGTVVGQCPSGYSGNPCTDINECQTNNGGCSQTCQNTAGSFRCVCGADYALQTDGRTCKLVCDPKCANCTNTPTNCTMCAMWYFKDPTTQQCTDLCPGYLHPNMTSRVCEDVSGIVVIEDLSQGETIGIAVTSILAAISAVSAVVAAAFWLIRRKQQNKPSPLPLIGSDGEYEGNESS